jgi:hypothetical protein
MAREAGTVTYSAKAPYSAIIIQINNQSRDYFATLISNNYSNEYCVIFARYMVQTK